MTHVVDTTMFWSATGGGVRRYLRTKQAWLARQPGWSHTIAVPGAAEAGLAMARLPAWPIPGSGGYALPLSRRAVARVLVDLRPDLVEAGDPYRVAWGALDAADRLGVPAVAYCHSNLEAMARLAAPRALASSAASAARRYARHLYRRFDRVLAPSQAMRQQLIDWGVERAECQPLGVDTTTFHPSRASRDWRAARGYDDATRLLVFAGRFAPEKHLDVLAEAVRRLGAPWRLLAIGAGPVTPRGDRVDVLPFVADVHELATALASADAFVHAGDQETFGLSVLEAMACGTPVVARHAGGLAELVDDRVGRSVHSGRAEDFAEAIRSIVDTDLHEAARARAETHDWERVLPGLLVTYRQLLRDRPLPALTTASTST